MGSCRMLKDIAAVKCAVEICNDFDIKKEILCAPGSEYYLNKNLDSQCDRRDYWTEILEKKTIEKLKQHSLPECIKDNITGLVLSVGMKMLCWAEYHEGMFGLSRERSVDFLNPSFFTSLGIIDNKKTAEQLMDEESFNIEQKFRLACIFCFTGELPVLFHRITSERKKAYYNGRDPTKVIQPALIKFWSYYLMGDTYLLQRGKTVDQYRLDSAVKSGSLAAVEYCFRFSKIGKEKDILTYAALKTVSSMLKENSEMYAFVLKEYDFQSNVWTPKYYYMDLICFLLSKMQEREKVNFLKKDIEVYSPYYYDIRYTIKHSKVLEYFLDWPYQLYFLETEKLVREFLPERSFANLLLIICSKIENRKYRQSYDEDKCFDYRNLLQEFWLKSFDRCNKYTLQVNKTLENAFKLTLEEIKDILNRLLTLKNFTYRDLDNILLILNYRTYDERKNIIYSEKGKNMCFDLLQKERWEVLDKFVLKCFVCKDEAKELKKDLISSEEAKRIFRNFMQNYKLDAIHCFIDWIPLSEEELVRYKEEIIFSNEGRRLFMKIVFENGDNETAYELCKLLVSAEKVNELKKILLSEFDFYYCSDSFNRNCQQIENFLQWATSSVDEIKKFKYELVYKKMDFFKKALTHFEEVSKIDCDWISVEKLLTWCLSSEKEILEYKKVLLERFGVQIHFELIRENKWAEAETFFAWLGVDISDIQKLKKNTIFEKIETILKDLKCSKNCSTYDFVDCYFSSFGGLQDRLELLLRWCLCDKQSVLEFKSLLEEIYLYADDIDLENILNNFDLAIEEFLIGLKPDHFRSKRKSEVLSPPKKRQIFG